MSYMQKLTKKFTETLFLRGYILGKFGYPEKDAKQRLVDADSLFQILT